MIRHRAAVPFFALATLAAAPAQETAARFDPGRQVCHQKLLTPGTTDTWPLELEADEVVRCIVDSATFDPVLSLTDDQGNVVRENDGEGTTSRIDWRALRKGTHQLRVAAFRGSGGGNYTIVLQRFRSGPATPTGEATHAFDDTRWWHFRIPLRSGEMLVPKLHGDARITAVLDESLEELPEHLGSYRARTDGDCYVRIEGAEGRRVQVLTSLAAVEERSPGGTFAAELPAHGMHVVRFALRAGQVLRVDGGTSDDSVAFAWTVLAKDGHDAAVATPATFDKPGRWRHWHVVRRDATGVLWVRNHAARPARVDLAATLATESMTVGEALATTMPRGDGVLRELQLRAGQLVDLRVHGDHFDGRLHLWDADGTVVATNDDAVPGQPDPRVTFLVPRTGTWRVLADTAGGVGAGPFTLTSALVDVPALGAGDACDLRIDAGSPGYAHVELQRDEVVWIAVTAATLDAALQVSDPAGDASFVREDGGIGGDVLTAYRATRAGTHTLLVHARSGSGTAKLRLLRP